MEFVEAPQNAPLRDLIKTANAATKIKFVLSVSLATSWTKTSFVYKEQPMMTTVSDINTETRKASGSESGSKDAIQSANNASKVTTWTRTISANSYLRTVNK